MNHTVLNIAHRGARSLAPENTLLAAQKAFDIGADMWELDCGMLADDEIIIMHDDTFKRTTNVAEIFPGRESNHLSTFLWSEVSQLEAGSFFTKTDPFEQIKSGNVKESELTEFSTVKIPTLREALQFTKDHNWRVNVEIKNMKGTPGDSKIVGGVIRLIQEMNMQSHVLISSFNHQYLAQCHAIDPTIQTATLLGMQKPGDLKKTLAIGCSAYHPPVYALTMPHIKRARKLGLNVNIWTVNEKAKMLSLIEAGATGIITDFPQIMAEMKNNRVQ